jgi:hypothetical protein
VIPARPIDRRACRGKTGQAHLLSRRAARLPRMDDLLISLFSLTLFCAAPWVVAAAVERLLDSL